MDMAVESKKRESDEPWLLPEGWAWVELRQVGSWTSGGTPKSNESDYYNGSIPWFRITELNEGRLIKAEKSLTVRGLNKSSAKLIKAPFLMFAMYGASIGKMAISEIDASTNQAIACCAPSSIVDIDYLFLSLQRLKKSIIALGQGGAQPNISQRILLECRIPLAPIAEQRRIVARIDALFDEIAEGELALEAARKGLETYRRALLKAAVTGELTAEWRSRHDDAASAADLLACLRSRYPRERPTIAGWSAPASLPTIPDSWTWCAVAEAGEVQLGRQRAPQHHAGDHMRPYLRVANVLEDHFDLTDVKAMNFTPAEFETFELRTGDILLNEGQAPDLLGRSAIYNGEIPGCCFQKTLLRFRAKEGVNPAYAQLVFRHYMHSGRFKRESRITTNIGHLTQVRFVVMEFPLPPSLEQDAIVALFGELDAALGELDPIATDAVRLRQSVLKAAFEGRLVPQDESDEPATMMLARFEASQAEAPRRRRGRPMAVTP